MQKLSNIRAVGFDLDDTLVMTEPSAFEFENKVLSLMGRPPGDRDVHKATWGRHIADAITERSPGVDVSKFMKHFQEEWQKQLETKTMDELSPEVDQMLKRLGERGYYLFILTGRDGFETAHLAAADHPISIHIAPENLYHKDNVGYPKPDPRAFDWLFKKGFSPAECVFIGDSLYDAQAACGAGLHFVATLESGLRRKSDFQDYPVAAFVDNLSQLPDILA